MTDLGEEQLALIADRLAALQASLEEVLENTKDGTRPVNLKDNIGRLSRMDELHNQSILVANRTVLSNRLKAVKRARERVVDGDFGYCEDCGEPIAFARLEAYPDATLCVPCQGERESR